jgi:hypothetical protein
MQWDDDPSSVHISHFQDFDRKEIGTVNLELWLTCNDDVGYTMCAFDIHRVRNDAIHRLSNHGKCSRGHEKLHCPWINLCTINNNFYKIK